MGVGAGDEVLGGQDLEGLDGHPYCPDLTQIVGAKAKRCVEVEPLELEMEVFWQLQGDPRPASAGVGSGRAVRVENAG